MLLGITQALHRIEIDKEPIEPQFGNDFLKSVELMNDAVVTTVTLEDMPGSTTGGDN